MSTTAVKNYHRHGIRALAVARGDVEGAKAFMAGQDLAIRHPVMRHFDLHEAMVEKADIHTTAEFVSSEVATSFLESVSQRSVSGRLRAMRRIPLRTRLYIAPRSGAVLATVAEGAPIPVISGEYAEVILEPVKIAAISVQTLELARSPNPAASVLLDDELVSAMAAAENRCFVSPTTAGSLLIGSPDFASAGSSAAQIDAMLLDLVDAVPGAGDTDSGVWLASPSTWARMGLVNTTGGQRAYPNVGIDGGELLGLRCLPVEELDEAASPIVRHIALLASSDIFWGDSGEIALDVSQQAALQVSATPSEGATNLISCFASNLFATRAVKWLGWHARSGASAFGVLTGL